MFFRDFREIERTSYPEMQLLLQILCRFTAHQLLSRPNAKDMAFRELIGPKRLIEFKFGHISIGAFLIPSQEMTNYISLERARGRSKVPSYTPLIASDVAAAQRAAPPKEGTAAAAW